jgi:DNA helicase-2/ATP-dependent DNA helicase PcrA
LFPISSASADRKELEEERRLMYVGITRARQKLFLSWATTRYRFGELSYSSRSRFIDELEGHLDVVETSPTANAHRAPRRRTSAEILSEFSARRKTVDGESHYRSDPMPAYEDESQIASPVRVGAQVVHETFGSGKILAIDGLGDNARAIVDFKSVGRKHLMLKFANLRLP